MSELATLINRWPSWWRDRMAEVVSFFSAQEKKKKELDRYRDARLRNG